MNIVLLEPEIPFNTGNIGRTCVSSNTKLHLIKPLGFSVDDKHLKRSGLDYWQDLNVSYYENFEDFLEKNNYPKIYMATTKARHIYTEVQYEYDSYIMFGKESAGIPEEILVKYPDTSIRIPMDEKYRSLNLSTSVAIVLYEALRQQNFKSLLFEGNLHRLKWD
ncbi:tRNA (cytidine(34)-2'-O)-methyltransferase [Anaeropeptidivorans aminofermentans]|uniref:tRNA (cytidine(34)-2'-O)-methyltransferase n=1 Tax=Anaeropeptidivorans aminofermentans TaxID=2934315 RepID=UPI002025418E|nr:tRNA (cytidine(34)-2'-O)-methyltransferase [Anaeropeptidivorans aminofermentans]